MNKLLAFLKRHILLIPLLILVVVVIGGITYFGGNQGIQREGVRTLEDNLPQPTPLPSLAAPDVPFAGLDPAIVDYLNDNPAFYDAAPGFDLEPLGAYLPRTGTAADIFNATQPTPTPTPLPYPTAPPLPLPLVGQTVLPTVSPFTDEGIPRTVPYVVADGTACAPEGNPVEGILTQRFHRYHGGIDIGVGLGTPVLATHSGEVTFAGWSDVGYGYLVTLESGPYITYYAHNTSFNVSEGQFVGRNSIIAWSGSTGNSSGPHVHYETRIDDVTVDPLTFHQRRLPTC